MGEEGRRDALLDRVCMYIYFWDDFDVDVDVGGLRFGSLYISLKSWSGITILMDRYIRLDALHSLIMRILL